MSSGYLIQSLKNIDLYSIPFQYNLKNQYKSNKTLIGGLFSLLIGLLSITYLLYLCTQYATNDFQPTISIKHVISKDSFSIKIPPDFITQKIILSNGQNLIEYQTQNNRNLMILGLEHRYIIQEGKQTIDVKDYYKMSPCTNSQLKDYFCINYLKKLKQEPNYDNYILLNYDNSKSRKDQISLLFSTCDERYLDEGEACEPDKDLIKKLLVSIDTSIWVQLKLQQFNSQTKQVEEKWKSEKYYFDPNIAFISQISLKKDETALLDGFIIQEKHTFNYINEYSRVDTNLSKDYMNKFYDLNLFGGVTFFLNDFNTSTNIQYIAFPSLLAQFSSVFHTLLLVGFFCKKISEADIISELISLQLKVKYKASAIHLVDKQSPLSSLNPLQLYQKIQSFNLKENASKIFGIGFFGRILLYFRKRTQNKLKNSMNMSREKSIFFELFQSTQKQTNIFELQKQLMEIQIMLKLLFNEEQYAAIKLCGMQIPEKQEPQYCTQGNLLNEKTNQNEQIIITQRDQQNHNEDNHQIQNPQFNHSNINIELSKEQQQILPKSTLQPVKQIEYQTNPSDVNIEINNLQIPLSKSIQRNEIQNCYEEFDSESQNSLPSNHLERLEQIENDVNYFESNVQKFLEKYKKQSFKSTEIDKRIYNCMIGVRNYSNSTK